MSFYTLADLLAHWERGELTLEEVLASWPHGGLTPEELLRELLQVILVEHGRLWTIEQRLAALVG